ncbi:hypothetical protein UA08_06364 [Talaromyces atroroseus]|uniref:YCII-related domain-containing protein n=1 Tax=Talaromyces atroroseus TaxID=1441469 RepID=A0A225ABN8_TALAT|nr:hypothetical protein UA08_06364 [Talaromyces atroroseus]OKL58491.1 hypothetical protein UA08_06364 [Talaromyces atroroseus]
MSYMVQNVTRRAFSAVSSAKGKTSEWLVMLADKPGVLERRIRIRPTHSKNFVKLHQSGIVSWAGPVFKEHVKEGLVRPFIGSMMVVNAPSREMVREILEQDVFVKEGIWDWEHVQILPFETLLRRPTNVEGGPGQ